MRPNGYACKIERTAVSQNRLTVRRVNQRAVGTFAGIAVLNPVGFHFFHRSNISMAKATARHILVASEEKCNELKTQIEAGADFAEVAKSNSSCPSSRQGGDLGSFGPGQMVKEFDTVVFSAPINVVQGPVKTQFGYHLLEVTSRQD
jgi:peptidyl-prolyl cis-trans isomerase C